jgi:heat shock protein HslJ
MAVPAKRLPVNEQLHVFRLPTASFRKQTDMKQIIPASLVLTIFMAIIHPVMSQDSKHPLQDTALLNTHWTLVSIAGADIPKTAQEAFIIFDEVKQSAYGSSGCNRMTGKFSQEGSKLKIGPMAGTRMACEPASMNIENEFYKALGDVDSYRIEGNKLLLKKGELVLATLKGSKI